MRFALPLLLAGCAFGQSCPSGLTAVADTLYAPAGPAGAARLMQGSVTITPWSPSAANGSTFGAIPYKAAVRNGVFLACLAPNDAAPLTAYTAKYLHTDAQGSASWSETWFVPSYGPVSVAAIRRASTVITFPAPTTGSACLHVFNGAPLGPWTPCVSWSLLTADQYQSITFPLWSLISQ